MVYWDTDGEEYSSSDEDFSTYCTKCRKEYHTENALKQHSIKHLPNNIECYGCTNTYKRFCDMLLHLERDECPGGITLADLNKTAAMCFQQKHYLDQDYRQELLCLDDSYLQDKDNLPFKCPKCGQWFKRLSALFQHGWSTDCDCHWVFAKLKRWLWNRHA